MVDQILLLVVGLQSDVKVQQLWHGFERFGDGDEL